MSNKDYLFDVIKKQSEQMVIPQSVEPDNIRKMLKQKSAEKAADRFRKRKVYRNIIAAAACLCAVLVGIFGAEVLKNTEKDGIHQERILAESEEHKNILTETAEKGIAYPKITYEDIYASMSEQWSAKGRLYGAEAPAADEVEGEVIAENAAMEELASDIEESASKQFGETNVQTIGVDEGDIVKNDGRYLYQKIRIKEEQGTKWLIQIVDTSNGMKEVARIEGIDQLVEFYVWEDILVTIEQKHLEHTSKGVSVCHDMLYYADDYHEITFFNIKDRSNPQGIKRFTLQGQYASSRISDGYFYGISRFYGEPGEGDQDYDAYVPMLDGCRLAFERIYLPEESEATSYLVLVSIDLRNPTTFTDTTGMICGGNLYYVSSENIFVAEPKMEKLKEGWSSNRTELYRFSYKDGMFTLQAMGEVKGQLEGSFSMDEYEEHLRVVTTVWDYHFNEIFDERTGESIGWDTTGNRQSNAVYVLDDKLNIVGKIEGLAPNEQIYSARFMGDTGYFVTFRQVDPLFTVDLKDPKKPAILSELKVSGFSEYLHVYDEDRLLGIGMEADEETGSQEGLKISMFDISDKMKVSEISKKIMAKYNYSEALYNHRAVMISTARNLFGFAAEGSDYGQFYRKYFVFTFENDEFVKKLEIDTKNKEGNYDSVRGTFIGDVFYLLIGDGSIKSYDLNTGNLKEVLEP